MKRTLYTLPAVMVVIFYTMLGLLAGGFGSFQPKAWLTIIAPVTSALLLLGKRWWGAIPGMLLGGLYISSGLYSQNHAVTAAGILIFGYYLVMGLLCHRDAQKTKA